MVQYLSFKMDTNEVQLNASLEDIKINNYLKLAHWVMQFPSFDWLSGREISTPLYHASAREIMAMKSSSGRSSKMKSAKSSNIS